MSVNAEPPSLMMALTVGVPLPWVKKNSSEPPEVTKPWLTTELMLKGVVVKFRNPPEAKVSVAPTLNGMLATTMLLVFRLLIVVFAVMPVVAVV